MTELEQYRQEIDRIDGELVVTEPKTKNSVRKVALSQQAVALLVQEHEQHPDSPILFPSPRTGRVLEPGRGIQDQPQTAGKGRHRGACSLP